MWRKKAPLNAVGFTLVELMVALVLASLMMIAMVATFVLQGKAYTATRMSTELQDNARTAMDIIDMMVSNAGFGVVKGDTRPQYNGTEFQPFDSAAFCFYTPGAAPSYICNYSNPSQGDSYTTATMDGTQCANSSWSKCPPYGTDSLVFAYREPGYLGTNLSVNAGASTVSFDDEYPTFTMGPNDIGFIVDQGHVESALVTAGQVTPAQVTNNGQLVTIQLNQNQSFFNELDLFQNANKVAIFNNAANGGGFFQKVDVVHLYVDYSDANHPALMMQINGSPASPLADNIEDFQVQFIMDDTNVVSGYDLLGSYTVTNTNSFSIFPSFNNVYYDPTSTSPPLHQNPLNINAIVITIVARSDTPSASIATPPATWVADHNTNVTPYPTPTLGPLANYQRQTYQRIIQLPNIRTASKLYDNRWI